MAPAKLFNCTEKPADRSRAMVNGVDVASVQFLGVAQRWGHFARRTASQILENRNVSCGMLLAGAQIGSHQNTLLIQSGP